MQNKRLVAIVKRRLDLKLTTRLSQGLKFSSASRFPRVYTRTPLPVHAHEHFRMPSQSDKPQPQHSNKSRDGREFDERVSGPDTDDPVAVIEHLDKVLSTGFSYHQLIH